MTKARELSIKKACDLMNDVTKAIEERYMINTQQELFVIYGAVVLFEALERLEDILSRKSGVQKS